jgi:hypothetical protein
MRLVLVIAILTTLVASSAWRQPSLVTSTAAQAAQPPVAAVGTGPQTDAHPAESSDMNWTQQFELIRWAVTQGGLTIVLLIVLASYRRDFFRKDDGRVLELAAKEEEKRQLKEDKRELVALLRDLNTTNQAQVVSVVQNTNATNKLAESVDRFAERRVVLRREADPSS